MVVGMGRGEGCWIPFRSRANREHLERCEGLLPGAHGQNLALTVLYLPCLLESSVVVGGTNAAWTEVSRCRANMAHIRQSGPDSGLGFQVKVLTLVSVVHFGGGGGRQRCVDRDASASERRGNTLKGLKAVYIYIYILNSNHLLLSFGGWYVLMVPPIRGYTIKSRAVGANLHQANTWEVQSTAVCFVVLNETHFLVLSTSRLCLIPKHLLS